MEPAREARVVEKARREGRRRENMDEGAGGGRADALEGGGGGGVACGARLEVRGREGEVRSWTAPAVSEVRLWLG